MSSSRSRFDGRAESTEASLLPVVERLAMKLAASNSSLDRSSGFMLMCADVVLMFCLLCC